MKQEIHPNYVSSKIECACGNVIQTGSTAGDYKTEICSSCHPFYTGDNRIIDSAGRIDKFKKRYSKYNNQPA